MASRQLDTDNEGDHVEALEAACEEARETLDQQVTWLRQIDQKSIRILRANILLLGLTLTALSILVRTDTVGLAPYVNLYTGFGVLLLLGSTNCAGITYISSRFEGGVDAQDVQDTFEDEYSPEEFYDRLARGYSNWIEYNNLVVKVNAHLCTITILLAINAVVFITVGAIAGAAGYDGTTLSYVLFVCVLVALFALDYLVFKIDDALKAYHSWNNGGD